MNDTPPTIRTLLRWLGWFGLANGLVLAAIFTRYVAMMPEPSGALPRIFVFLSLLGHGLTAGLLVFVLCLPPALLLPRKRLVTGLAVLISCALVFGVAVDSVVFSLYRFHMNGMIWKLLSGGSAGQMLHLSAHTWWVGSLMAGGVLLGELLLARLCWRWSGAPRHPWGCVAALVGFLILLSGQLIHVWADGVGYAPVTRQVRYLPGYKPLTARKLMRKLGWETSRDARVKLPDKERAFRYPLEPLTLEGVGTGHHLLLIAIDGWRRDFLDPDVTPNLNRLAQRSWTFDDHFSAGISTRFGMFGLVYGIPSSYWHSALAEQTPPVLMEALDRRGYEMGLYFSASTSSPEFDRTLFASVRDRLPPDAEGPDAVARDRVVTNRFHRFLNERDPARPFFGFLFYDAPHSYVCPPGEEVFTPAAGAIDHLRLGRETDPAPLMNKLQNSVRYVDGLVGELLDRLEGEGLLDETVVVVTGDHGEAFNDDGLGYWGHNSGFGLAQARVPLIVHWPGEAVRRFSHRTSHLDVAPTLLADLLGAGGDPAAYASGRNLRDEGPRDTLLVSSWSSFALVEPDRMTVVLPTGEVECRGMDYRLLDDGDGRPQAMLRALKELGRFHR